MCPGCGAAGEGGERFCSRCGLPLVPAGSEPIVEALDARHDRARKIRPQLAEGRLTKVAFARNQTEGEFIQGLLLEVGVPSLLRRSAGYDVPDFLAAGPRDVLVPLSGVDTAREVLLQSEVPASGAGGEAGAGVSGGAGGASGVGWAGPSPLRLLAGLLIALALGALVVWLLSLGVH